jgi:hypothetical protein
MKHRLAAGALLLCSALAHAQPIFRTFSYTGFYDQEASAFLSDQQLQGSFSGDDANGDGVLDRAELASLMVDSVDYATCAGGAPSAYCGADRFSYAVDGDLSFSLGSYGGDPEGLAGGGRLITSGEMDYAYRYDPYTNSERHLLWTDATRLVLQDATVTAAVVGSVPEAPSWTLLLLGVGVMAGLQYRARCRARYRVRQRTEPSGRPA